MGEIRFYNSTISQRNQSVSLTRIYKIHAEYIKIRFYIKATVFKRTNFSEDPRSIGDFVLRAFALKFFDKAVSAARTVVTTDLDFAKLRGHAEIHAEEIQFALSSRENVWTHQ